MRKKKKKMSIFTLVNCCTVSCKDRKVMVTKQNKRK